MTATAENPGAAEIRAQLSRHLHPSPSEDDYTITEVEGEIPRELYGTLYRNGPSQKVLPPEGAGALHLFDGDGLVHAFRFEDGRAAVQSRFVRHESFVAEQAEGRFCMDSGNVKAEDPIDLGRVQPNTNIVLHAGRLFALVENAPPFELDPKTLEPLGTWDYDGKMVGFSTTAHPKIDGRTGQMVIHGYQPVEPYLSLYVVEADRRVTVAEAMDAPWPSMIHDLAISQDHVIIPLGPVRFDVEALAAGKGFGGSLSWEPDLGLKFAVRSRESGGEIRWFDAPSPGFMFHPGNAYEKDGVIYMDACTYPDGQGLLDAIAGIRSGRLGAGLNGFPFLYEFDLATGECRETQLSERPAEFPRLDDRLVGQPNRWGYAVTGRPNAVDPADALFAGLTKYDREGGPSVHRVLGHGQWTGEPVFVPRAEDAAEDDGFVLSVAYDGPEDRSFLQILDARDLAAEPVARLWLQHRVPLGFHGNWAPGIV